MRPPSLRGSALQRAGHAGGLRAFRRVVVAVAVFLTTALCSTAPLPALAEITRVVTYPAGWSLIAGTEGTVLTGMTGPLYTFQNGDAAYRAVPPGPVLRQYAINEQGPRAGLGYWAYFSQTTTIAIDLANGFPAPNPGIVAGLPPSGQSFDIAVPLARWVMIGNPWDEQVDVTGADAVYVYDAASGYHQTTTLAAGQGAFVYSNVSMHMFICPTGGRC